MAPKDTGHDAADRRRPPEDGGDPAVAVSRRRLLAGAAGGVAALALAGFVGYEWPGRRPARPGAVPGSASKPSYQPFFSRPDIRPPQVKLTNLAAGSTSPPYIFISPRDYLGGSGAQPGLMVLDARGRLVWFKPVTTAAPFDLNAQSYRGRPVLTWWQGQVVDDYGVGTGEMLSASYTAERPVQAGNGLKADLHELQFTSAGTALVTAYQAVPRDLSSLGGQKKGSLVVSHAQEVDLSNGKVLFDWDSLAHVGLDESYQTAPSSGEYDYFHLNSIAEMPDGDLLLSARNTWALYKVDRGSGKVIWRLNGKKSDFTMGPGASFYWQHDARPYQPGHISVFDDGATPAEERQSRGLLLEVGTSSRRVTLSRAYLHPAAFIAANQGSVQVLPNGNVFIGWGNQPYFSEFSPDGALVLDGELPRGWHSYRAFRYEWTGRPASPPAIAVLADPAGGNVVYASWNGATEVRAWKVLAGKGPAELEPVGGQAWTGFETAIAVNTTMPYYAVVALGTAGLEIGRSRTVKWPG